MIRAVASIKSAKCIVIIITEVPKQASKEGFAIRFENLSFAKKTQRDAHVELKKASKEILNQTRSNLIPLSNVLEFNLRLWGLKEKNLLNTLRCLS